MKIEFEKEKIKKFGYILSAVVTGLGVTAFVKHGSAAHLPVYFTLSLVILALNIIDPRTIYPVYWVMIQIAVVMGAINAFILLCIIYYLLLTPTGLILKMLGKDLLGLKIDKAVPSYWALRKRRLDDRSAYEKQY